MSYANIIGHQSMVFDDHRNSLYAKALKQVINPDSVVLDLGAGLGIHGLMAASMGAKKVYLVEPHADLEVAASVARENGLDDRVHCIQGAIEEVTLPEKVDVIVSVLTGNFLLEEDLLSSLFYARDIFLKAGGKLIPDCAMMEVVPVSLATQFRKMIEQWSEPSQSIEFGSVRQYAANRLYFDQYQDVEHRFLSRPEKLCELNFLTAHKAECKQKIEFVMNIDGECHGFLGWFRTRLGNHWLSTSPVEKETHWSQVYLPLDPPYPLKHGEKLKFEINRPEFGEWTWVTEHAGEVQKHSTFLSEPMSRSKLQRKSDHHRAVLNDKGRAAKEILEMLNGELSTDDIAEITCKSYPHLFPARQHAKRFVRALIDRYS